MFWTARQAAAFLGSETHHVYYLINMGKIEAVKIGKALRVVSGSVRAYKAKCAASIITGITVFQEAGIGPG